LSWIGYFSGTVTRSAIDWYPTLVKPVLIPELDFAPVWSTLYIMMGIAAGLVWDRMDSDKEGVKKALILFAITGAKCFVVVFIFGLRNPC
jgi:tryptophan-rich sensory protein